MSPFTQTALPARGAGQGYSIAIATDVLPSYTAKILSANIDMTYITVMEVP